MDTQKRTYRSEEMTVFDNYTLVTTWDVNQITYVNVADVFDEKKSAQVVGKLKSIDIRGPHHENFSNFPTFLQELHVHFLDDSQSTVISRKLEVNIFLCTNGFSAGFTVSAAMHV